MVEVLPSALSLVVRCLSVCLHVHCARRLTVGQFEPTHAHPFFRHTHKENSHWRHDDKASTASTQGQGSSPTRWCSCSRCPCSSAPRGCRYMPHNTTPTITPSQTNTPHHHLLLPPSPPPPAAKPSRARIVPPPLELGKLRASTPAQLRARDGATGKRSRRSHRSAVPDEDALASTLGGTRGQPLSPASSTGVQVRNEHVYVWATLTQCVGVCVLLVESQEEIAGDSDRRPLAKRRVASVSPVRGASNTQDVLRTPPRRDEGHRVRGSRSRQRSSSKRRRGTVFVSVCVVVVCVRGTSGWVGQGEPRKADTACTFVSLSVTGEAPLPAHSPIASARRMQYR